MEIGKNFAENLKKFRIRNNYSQTGLANKIEVKPQTISKYEKSEAFPNSDNLEKLMMVLGVSPNELFQGEEEFFGDRVESERRLLDFLENEELIRAKLDTMEANISEPIDEINLKKEWKLYIQNYLNEDELSIEELKEIANIIFGQRLAKAKKYFADVVYDENVEKIMRFVSYRAEK
jgi:transcriptional regulator with XRE-family HTH domain